MEEFSVVEILIECLRIDELDRVATCGRERVVRECGNAERRELFGRETIVGSEKECDRAYIQDVGVSGMSKVHTVPGRIIRAHDHRIMEIPELANAREATESERLNRAFRESAFGDHVRHAGVREDRDDGEGILERAIDRVEAAEFPLHVMRQVGKPRWPRAAGRMFELRAKCLYRQREEQGRRGRREELPAERVGKRREFHLRPTQCSERAWRVFGGGRRGEEYDII
ncbi:hypothetical protein HY632_03860 [Candidatus Uhrbacteria bacterium]|nr:hypothetical protein [Candidatus Uhrbacteria bacterium]